MPSSHLETLWLSIGSKPSGQKSGKVNSLISAGWPEEAGFAVKGSASCCSAEFTKQGLEKIQLGVILADLTPFIKES